MYERSGHLVRDCMIKRKEHQWISPKKRSKTEVMSTQRLLEKVEKFCARYSYLFDYSRTRLISRKKFQLGGENVTSRICLNIISFIILYLLLEYGYM